MIAGVSLLAFSSAAWADRVDRYDDQWHYSLTPYAWFPNISQTLQFTTPLGGGKSVDVEVKPDNYLSDLEFALMGTFEARKGNWALAMVERASARLKPEIPVAGAAISLPPCDNGQLPALRNPASEKTRSDSRRR